LPPPFDLGAGHMARSVLNACEAREEGHGLSEATLLDGANKRNSISATATGKAVPAAVFAPRKRGRVRAPMQDAGATMRPLVHLKAKRFE
jgi:hypothetical protein